MICDFYKDNGWEIYSATHIDPNVDVFWFLRNVLKTDPDVLKQPCTMAIFEEE